MKYFLFGVLLGFLYLALLTGVAYMAIADECQSRGYNSAFIGKGGAVCVNMSDLEREDFRIEVGSF